MAVKNSEHPQQIGPYEILGALGKGSMGQVYKAMQTAENRVVAIKVLPREFLDDESRIERFNREAQAVAMIDHPNVVRIIEKDQEGDTLYLVMEFVPGASLAEIMRQRRLSLRESLVAFKGICNGLEAAHRESITHRDLSPRNILVSDDLSVVKLSDFGISRVEAISRELGTLSTTETSMGSLHYMAPEQARKMSDVDHRSDIYSAGVVLYEMLTGRVPVGRFSLPSQLNSEVPPDFDPVVLKCLASDPNDRYPTVGKLKEQISRLEDQFRLGLVDELKGISRGTSEIFLRSTRTFTRNRKLTAVLAGALLVAVVAAGVFFLRRPSAPQQPAVPVVEVAEPAPVEAPAPIAPDTSSDQGEALAGMPELDEPADDLAAEEPEPDTEQVAAEGEQGTSQVETEEAPPPSRETRSNDAAREDLRVAREKLEARLYEPALEDLESFLDTYPDSPLQPDAYLLIAHIHRQEGRTEDAMAALVEVNSRFGGTPQAAEGLFTLAQLTLGGKGRERKLEAREIFTEVAATSPNTTWAPQALAAKASIENDEKLRAQHSGLGASVPAAMLTYEMLVDRYPTAEQAESAYWNLGKMYQAAKSFDRAAKAFADLGDRFPETRYDAWWEAGELYQEKLDDPESAIAAFQRVPSRSPRHDAAQKRLRKLQD